MSNDMQDQWEDFEEDFDEEPRRPQGNDLVKQLRKADRVKDKQIKELEAELAHLRSERRSNTVAKILETEGINSKIAKFIPTDVTDEDAVKAWLDENSEVFGFTRSGSHEISEDEVALKRMNNVSAGALSPTQIDDIYSRIDKAESPEELAALLSELG